MKVRERSRRRGEGGVGLRECKQITSNSVSDWLEWEMLRGREGWEAALSMPVGDALRMCFPPLLFISLIYLYISVGSAIGRAGQARAIFIYFPPTSRGFPIGALWLAVRAINLAKVEMKWSPFSSSSSPCTPVECTWHCVQIRPCWLRVEPWQSVSKQLNWLLQVLWVDTHQCFWIC